MKRQKIFFFYLSISRKLPSVRLEIKLSKKFNHYDFPLCRIALSTAKSPHYIKKKSEWVRLNDRSVILSFLAWKKVSFYYEEGKLDGSKTLKRASMVVEEKMKRFSSSSMCELSHKSEKHAAKWASFSFFFGVKRKLRRRKMSIEINACFCMRLMAAKVFIICVSNINIGSMVSHPCTRFCVHGK